jgi:hypothetical protein
MQADATTLRQAPACMRAAGAGRAALIGGLTFRAAIDARKH